MNCIIIGLMLESERQEVSSLLTLGFDSSLIIDWMKRNIPNHLGVKFQDEAYLKIVSLKNGQKIRQVMARTKGIRDPGSGQNYTFTLWDGRLKSEMTFEVSAASGISFSLGERRALPGEYETFQAVTKQAKPLKSKS